MKKVYTITFSINNEIQHDEKMYAVNDSEIINGVVNRMNMLINSEAVEGWQNRPTFNFNARESGRQILDITF